MLPISKVVVMEDRAQVERAGEVTLNGETTLEIAGLSLAFYIFGLLAGGL